MSNTNATTDGTTPAPERLRLGWWWVLAERAAQGSAPAGQEVGDAG